MTLPVQVNWRRCIGDDWCPLENLNLSSVNEVGVYIIWHGGTRVRYVYVGQGVVADRLSEHKLNPDILQYRASGTLFVTWAAVSPRLRDGIERYLADFLRPMVGSQYPDVTPIPVNTNSL